MQKLPPKRTQPKQSPNKKKRKKVTISHKLSNHSFFQTQISHRFIYQFIILLVINFQLKTGLFSYQVMHTTPFQQSIQTLFIILNQVQYSIKNIRWNSKLRAKFNYGLWDPFLGLFVGTGHGQTEYNEIDFEDTMIPLDIKEEFEARDSCLLQ